ncbi:hypothetical protein Tco_0163184, partial [Tanacetum coccineum]
MRCGKSRSSSTFRSKIMRAEEKICKKNDVKARSLLLMAMPNEHQLTFNQLQKLVSRLAILGVVTPPEDLNVKFFRSLPSEWDTHVVVWMNKPDFDTMGLDDLYNNFKIVEQKVKRSTVSTGTSKVNTASTETSTASFSVAIVYAFLSTQSQGSQLVHEDLEQLHDDDLEEMDLKWNMALLSMRARKFYQRTGRKIIIDGSSTAGYDKSKVAHQKASKGLKILLKGMCAIDGVGFDWSDMGDEKKFKLNHGYSWILRFEGLEEFKQPKVNEYGPKDLSVKPTTGCNKESDNSKENTDDSLKQQQKTDSSSIKSPLKVDKDWKEKNLCPANHVREEELKKDRENNDALIIKDWVLDDEDDVEPIPKVEKKTVIPTATKKEFVKPE